MPRRTFMGSTCKGITMQFLVTYAPLIARMGNVLNLSWQAGADISLIDVRAILYSNMAASDWLVLTTTLSLEQAELLDACAFQRAMRAWANANVAAG